MRTFFLLLTLSLLVATNAHALKLEVTLDGLDGEWRKNVEALLTIYQKRSDADLTEVLVQAWHRRASKEISDALAPFGLYRVKVNAALTPGSKPDGTWSADYSVVAGEQVRIGTVDYVITGEGADTAAFPKTFPLQAGDILLHSEYEQARSQIAYIAGQEGYLDAQMVRRRVLIDMDAYTAMIEFHLDTGPRYYLGGVTFTQDLLNDEYLKDFVNFKPGANYDQEELLRLQARLLGTEYFEKVEILPHKENADDNRVVPIEVIADRNKANKYRFGLGYATDVGPRVTLDWRRRYWGKRGHWFKLELSVADALQFFKGDYRIPIGDPVQDYISIQPKFESLDTSSRKEDINRLLVAHSVGTAEGWRRTTGIDYRHESFQIADNDSQVVDELVSSLSWSKTVTDDPIYTKDGYRLRYTLAASVAGVVSPASDLSATLQYKKVKAFRPDYRFITRADLGVTWADSLFDLPASRRFFSGGDNSIRGWGFDDLGPEDPDTNEALGGRYLAVASLELERRIKGDWSGAVFTDFGNAFDPDFESEIEVGTGLGLRWRSPIGQIRLDIAFALTRDGSPARLHLVIGPDL